VEVLGYLDLAFKLNKALIVTMEKDSRSRIELNAAAKKEKIMLNFFAYSEMLCTKNYGKTLKTRSSCR
jgi:hypothetical protein